MYVHVVVMMSSVQVSFWNVTSFSRSFNQENMKALASNGTIESLDLVSLVPFGIPVKCMNVQLVCRPSNFKHKGALYHRWSSNDDFLIF